MTNPDMTDTTTDTLHLYVSVDWYDGKADHTATTGVITWKKRKATPEQINEINEHIKKVLGKPTSEQGRRNGEFYKS